jgi:hypothetical protein
MNLQVLEENERSIHDALCVVRSLFKKRYEFADFLQDLANEILAADMSDTSFMIAGGSAVEMEVGDVLCPMFQRRLAYYLVIITGSPQVSEKLQEWSKSLGGKCDVLKFTVACETNGPTHELLHLLCIPI